MQRPDLLLLARHLSALDSQRLFGIFHLRIDQLEFRFQLRYLNRAKLSVNYAGLHMWRNAFCGASTAMNVWQRTATRTTTETQPQGNETSLILTSSSMLTDLRSLPCLTFLSGSPRPLAHAHGCFQAFPLMPNLAEIVPRGEPGTVLLTRKSRPIYNRSVVLAWQQDGG